MDSSEHLGNRGGMRSKAFCFTNLPALNGWAASRSRSPLPAEHDICLQCALLANSAGVGGGPFYIPPLNVVVGFSLAQCVALSHTIVSTSAIASALYGLTHTRPGYPDRPLVDLDVALIFIPALLFGTSIGTHCSQIWCDLS